MSEPCLVLLDRDGTILVEKDYLSDPDDVELIDGAASAIRRLIELNCKVVVVTNQSGIARGYFTLETVEAIHQKMIELLAEQGASLDGIFICPHGPEEGCSCRKPNTGLLLKASEATGISLANGIMVGDKAADILAGKAVGARTVLVRTGYGRTTENDETTNPDVILNSIADLPNLLAG